MLGNGPCRPFQLLEELREEAWCDHYDKDRLEEELRFLLKTINFKRPSWNDRPYR